MVRGCTCFCPSQFGVVFLCFILGEAFSTFCEAGSVQTVHLKALHVLCRLEKVAPKNPPKTSDASSCRSGSAEGEARACTGALVPASSSEQHFAITPFQTESLVVPSD